MSDQNQQKNLPPPPRPTINNLDGIRPEYIASDQVVRNQPQLIPRPPAVSPPFLPSGFYPVLFPQGTVITEPLMVGWARQNGILKDLTAEIPNLANIRADFNIFRPQGLSYPRANGPLGPPPPNNYTLVNNYSVFVNDLSNAGTNY